MAVTVELLETEGWGMVDGWMDHVYLTRRKNGTYTLKMHRHGHDETSCGYQYRSRPFRTAPAFLDALKEAEGSTSGGFEENLESILEEAETLDAALASQARVLLARCPWKEWDPDIESIQVSMHDLKRAQLDLEPSSG